MRVLSVLPARHPVGRTRLAGSKLSIRPLAAEPRRPVDMTDVAARELLLRAIDAVRAGHRLQAETVMIPFRIEQREGT